MIEKLGGWLVSFVRIIGSTVSGAHSAVLLGGTGAVGGQGDTATDEDGEAITDAEAYGVPPVVWRPRAPETVQVGGESQTLAAEAMALRTSSGLVPVAARDLRLNRKFSAPKAGSTAFVGYGGGFLSFDDTPDLESRGTFYVPYAGGTKAHVITLDPVTESIQIVHGDGFAVILDPDNGITLRGGSSSWINVKDGEISIVAGKVTIQGQVIVGAQPAAAVPLLAGPASPPSTSFFVSP